MSLVVGIGVDAYEHGRYYKFLGFSKTGDESRVETDDNTGGINWAARYLGLKKEKKECTGPLFRVDGDVFSYPPYLLFNNPFCFLRVVYLLLCIDLIRSKN